MVNSEKIYLAVLEYGLSLIAVNLPSFWYLLSHTSPEKMLRSLQSIISLRFERSAGSGHGGASPNRQPSHYDKRRISSSSHSHILQHDALHMESYIMRDLEDKDESYLQRGKIHITEPMSHSATQV